jgi:anti-anti-sigma factor
VRVHRTGAGDSQFRGWVEAGTVRLSGELDLSNADLLAGLLEVPGGREVVLDMTELDFIDVRGTAEVVRLARRLAPSGSVRIAAAPTSVRTVLECADWGSQPEIGMGLAG